MKNYVKQHIEQGSYGENPVMAGNSYSSVHGWADRLIHDSLVFSHRENDYTDETFYEGFHSHDYYEVVFYISGKVEYVCENDVFKPLPGMVIASLPDTMHTARLVSDSKYERYVFYFKRDFFSYCGEQLSLPAFFTAYGSYGALQPDEALFEQLRTLADAADRAAAQGSADGRALAYSYIIQFFALLGGESDLAVRVNDKLPENVARIKKYIDTYYTTIEGVSEIAAYFFYSREHASRLFRQYFNITLSEYLMQRRVAESAKLLLEGQSVAQACYAVGFRSVSSYINAFRRITGCLPSEYKKRR
ncbi:MAG: AraC family transcriptional regulator [Clostridia bacterium]|nr:AraC family transcriptional regulator [Clostridia bacterium]